MSRAAPKLRAVPPALLEDPIAEAMVNATKAAEATSTIREGLKVARLTEQKARDRFDAGDESVSVEDLAKAREVRESFERRLAAKEDDEQKARIVLAQRKAVRAKGKYEESVARVTSWRADLGSFLPRFAAIDAELGKLLEEVVDFVADRRAEHEEASNLEIEVQPLVSLAAQGIDPLTVSEVRELVRIYIAREREKAGRDGLADGWLDGFTKPEWKDTGRHKYDAAIAALDAMENTK